MESFEADLANFQNVKWLDYTQNLMDTQKGIFQSNAMFDVVIAVGTNRYKAHQLVLSACSEFFKDVLASGNLNPMPTIIIPDLNPQLVEPLLEFMYTGESFVNSTILSEFLEACSFLQIKGFISYDCLVNGIRLQQDPNHVISEQTMNDTDTKDNFLLPQNFEISDVVVSVDYPIKEYNIIDELELNKSIDSQGNSCHEQILSDMPVEEYLEDDDDVLLTDPTTDAIQTDLKLQLDSKTLASTWGRQPKSYTEATLNKAIEELRAGATVMDVSAKFEIPRSTIYSKLRHSKDPVYRTYRTSHLQDAARAVTETGISLKEASQKFDVSKTVLWRTLKKSSNYKPEERFHAARSEALEAIQKGDTLISISKRFNIPLATLHRDKVRLHTEGKLPEHCKLTRRDSGTSYQKRLRAALLSCKSGMPQKTASELHKVPKTTIWRHLQRANRQSAAEAANAANTIKVEPDEEGEHEEHEEPTLDGELEEQSDVMDDNNDAADNFEILNSFDEADVSAEPLEYEEN